MTYYNGLRYHDFTFSFDEQDVFLELKCGYCTRKMAGDEVRQLMRFLYDVHERIHNNEQRIAQLALGRPVATSGGDSDDTGADGEGHDD